MTKAPDSVAGEAAPQGDGAPEIEVTPAMIEAGLYELYEHNFGDDVKLVLEDVYRAMAYAVGDKVSASASKAPK
jgi:hypothetical protein